MSGNVLNTVGQNVFTIGFEITPIFLVGGVVSQFNVGFLPIVVLTEAVNLLNGLVTGTGVTLTDYAQYFAHFKPMPGGNLLNLQYGEYPFANLQIAANAAIFNPLRVSLIMQAPAKSSGAYVTKLATFTAIQYVIKQHALLGGYYVVATPAFIYTGMLLTELADITDYSNPKVQETWRWDFYQPLISQNSSGGVLSTLLQNITNGNPINGQPATSGIANAINNPAAAPNAFSGASNAVAGNAVIPVTQTPLAPLQ